ncbi:MAG: LysM peptidoglycan-binding domain-containing protein, partial [Planctomycetota bacterium]
NSALTVASADTEKESLSEKADNKTEEIESQNAIVKPGDSVSFMALEKYGIVNGQDETINSALTVESADAKNESLSEKADNKTEEIESQYVIVKPGDSVSFIALKKYGIVNREILKLIHGLNPEIKDLNVISIGQLIKFPVLISTDPAIRKNDALYGVHVASFVNFQDAITEHKRWLELDYEPQLIPVLIQGKGKWYRVILGAFSDESASKIFAEELLLKGKSHYAEVIPMNFQESTSIEMKGLHN